MEVQPISKQYSVAEPSVIFRDVIFKTIFKKFKQFFKSKSPTYETILSVGYDQLIPIIELNKHLYSDFPVINVDIDCKFKKIINKEIFNKQTYDRNTNLIVKAAFYPFGNKNWKLYSKLLNPVNDEDDFVTSLSIEMVIIYNDKFDMNNKKDVENLSDRVKAAIIHEMMHAYEDFQRILKSKITSNRNVYCSENILGVVSDMNTLKFPKIIWNFWDEFFLYYTYIYEPHEMRARLQELSYYIEKYPDKDLMKFYNYRLFEYMSKFDASDFYKRLLSKISEYKNYKGVAKAVADNLKKMWVRNYKKTIESQRTNPIIKISKLEKMNCKEFLQFWEKVLNESGEYGKRKSLKMTSVIKMSF